MKKTKRQDTGDIGEAIIEKYCLCPKCKATTKTLKRLPPNFKCADIICDFCGFLAQVKTKTSDDINNIENQIAGAGWAPQKARMDAGIYFPLYLVKVTKDGKKFSVFYLPSDYQSPEMFVSSVRQIKNRKPCEMFNYRLDEIKASMVRVR